MRKKDQSCLLKYLISCSRFGLNLHNQEWFCLVKQEPELEFQQQTIILSFIILFFAPLER